jgi:hypothetical protein
MDLYWIAAQHRAATMGRHIATRLRRVTGRQWAITVGVLTWSICFMGSGIWATMATAQTSNGVVITGSDQVVVNGDGQVTINGQPATPTAPSAPAPPPSVVTPVATPTPTPDNGAGEEGEGEPARRSPVRPRWAVPQPGVGYTLHTGGRHDLREVEMTNGAWADDSFAGLSGLTIGSAGCCAASLATVKRTLLGGQVKPQFFARKYRDKIAVRTSNGWSLSWRDGKPLGNGRFAGDQLVQAGRDMGLKVRRLSRYNLKTARRALQQGAVAIFQFWPGPFTGNGHCSVGYRADAQGIWFADPYHHGVRQNVEKRGWTLAQLRAANIAAIWVYFRSK